MAKTKKKQGNLGLGIVLGFCIGALFVSIVTPLVSAENFTGYYSPLDKNVTIVVEEGQIISCEIEKIIIPPIEPPVDPPLPPSNSTFGFDYTVYTTSYSINTLNALKNHYNDTNNNYLYDDVKGRVIVKNFSSDFRTVIGMRYLKEMDTKLRQAKENNFSSNDVIVWDVENYEGNDLFGDISKGSDIVRSNGYKFGLTPDRLTLLANYKKIDWSKVDWVGLQFQVYTNDVPKFVQNVNETSKYIKEKNPNIIIYAQNSFRQSSNCYSWRNKPNTDLSCDVDLSSSLRSLNKNIMETSKIQTVDGMILTYMPDDETTTPTHICPSLICNGPNLDLTLSLMDTINKK